MTLQQHQSQLGKYEIIEEVGRGGFGVVYKARDTKLKRIVALKVLKPHLLDDAEFVARFEKEAQAAAGLQHPNIVVVHELGEGSQYIAMEFLEGQSLDKIIVTEHRLTLERVSSILKQIASALDSAHSKGLIHRDVKPSNIIVGENDYATLTDFGLVKASLGSNASTTGQVLGTAEYMAPEQAEGKQVDSRTDVYALGIVLFEMLVGKVPFKAESTLATLYKQVNEPPPNLRLLRPDLPKGIESVVNRALAKNPTERFQTANALSEALNQALTPRQSIGCARIALIIGGVIGAIISLCICGWVLLNIPPPPTPIPKLPPDTPPTQTRLPGVSPVPAAPETRLPGLPPTGAPPAIPTADGKTTSYPFSSPTPSIPEGDGGLVVTSFIGDEINYTIGGILYRVPANGTIYIFLPPGRYPFSWNTPRGNKADCSTADSCTVQIQAGVYTPQNWQLLR